MEELKVSKDKTQRNLIITLVCITSCFLGAMVLNGILFYQILLSGEFNKGYNASNVAWAYHTNGIRLPIDGHDVLTVEKRKEGVKKDEAANIQR